MITELGRKNKVSVMLIGSAALLPSESWFGGELDGIDVKTVLSNYTVPRSAGTVGTVEFANRLGVASRVISI